MKRICSDIIIFAVTAAVTLSAGCKKVLDINEDPNNPGLENATPEVLFPSGVMSTAGMVGGQLAIVGGIWSQFWAQSSNSSQYREIDAYNLTSTSEEVNLSYQELFAGALNDYKLAIEKSYEREDWRYNLMLQVMRAYTYQVLVDLYDKVPYTQALQGQANLQPEFDEGYTIYVALIDSINNALAKDFKSQPFDQGQRNSDFVFAGDLNKWEQFANTLKLKFYLRMVNARPEEAAAGIRELYQNGGNFLQENAGVNVFQDIPNKSNPFYEFNIRRLNTTTNIRASFTFASWLIANNEPRSTLYFGTQTPIGIHQGDYTATLQQQPTYPNATVFVQRATDPVWFISAAESYFMQAEALERYFGGAGAPEMYNAGVTAAFAQAGLSAAAAAFIAPGGRYAYPATGSFEQKLEAIITQKWASLPGSHALEAFFEHNRTGYPAVSPIYSTTPGYIPGRWVYSRNGVTGPGNFPERFPFPDYERSRNRNTPPDANPSFPVIAKVWWAK